jgi:glycogen debranching enzyme
VDGAALLEAYGHPDADKWRQWAADLAARFRQKYWLSDADGPYPAIALDGRKRAVDGPASNMGHLVGSGLLTPAEEATVARRLLSPALASGYGLRTLADSTTGFNPLSYHAGSVWPHDTAIAALGLGRAGLNREAADLLAGLIVAAPSFDYRLPELYGGGRATPPLPPVPYPASCRPQAWAAAVGPALARVLLGIDADIPARRITLKPVTPSPIGAFEVHGVRIGGGTLAARVDAQGRTTVLQAPPGIEVVVR